MMKKLICACLLLMPVLAAGEPDTEALEQRLLEAQAQLGELAREIAELSSALGLAGVDRPGRAMTIMHRRGEGARRQLGLLVTAGERNDGLTVVGLTPSGPARDAGLERGDVLMAINGQSLAGSDAAGLARMVQALEHDEVAVIDIERAGERMTVEVQPRARGPLDATRLGDIDFDALGEWGRVLAGSLKENLGESLGEGLGAVDLSGLAQWLESGRQWPGTFAMSVSAVPGSGFLPGRLIANHEGLAPYFGTGEGVLVLDVRADNPWALAAGDVILRVAGHPVSRPVDIARHLRSSEDVWVDVEIMRAGSIEMLKITPHWRG
ncbi:MAG: PDZ domain-containing protein [Wenzhouxiangellaceae bacterium]|nr:MAG: PDZ domain-containing protein [Wenzhouxiangellaceae bacterium]